MKENIVEQAVDGFVQGIEDKELWLEQVDDCDQQLYNIVRSVVRKAINKSANDYRSKIRE